MKKILVTTAICLIGAASLMAQGRIAFVNSSTTPIRISANSDGSASVILGTASTAQFGVGPASAQIRLFAGATSSSLSPVLIGTAADQAFILNTASGIGSAQGTFAGGSPLPLPGFDGSSPVFLQFTLSLTPNSGAFSGVLFSYSSPIISVTPALAPATQTAVFGAGLWTTGGTLTPVPEPSSMALAGLGAASLLIFRRRK
jgi:hypothetical protein